MISISLSKETVIDLSSLRSRDVILSQYGFNMRKMIIKHNVVGERYLIITMPHWMKRENVKITYQQLEEQDWIYIGRYSRLRWALKF